MDCKGTHFFGITIYMHLFFRDFRAFCAFIDTYFLSFLKTNKHLFIHDVLTGFFSAGCHTLPQIAATRLRQTPAQPESPMQPTDPEADTDNTIPPVRATPQHAVGRSAVCRSNPGTARRPSPHRLDASYGQKKTGVAKPRSHQPQSGNHLAQSQSEEATSIQTNFSCSRR